MNIGIVGLGYVGLTLAIAAVNNAEGGGVKIWGVEVNPKIISSLEKNRAHFHETGLDALIEKHNNVNFHCVKEFPKEKNFDAFIITVGTPLKAGTHEPNFDYIREAIQSIKNVYDGSQLVILRSTVSVGTTRNIIVPFLRELCQKSEVFVSMCPERTIEGRAIEELTTLPQIISGNNQHALDLAEKLFLKITSSVIKVESLEEAELAKLYCNTYRDINFAIGNAFCLAAQSFNIDGIKVIQHANEGYSRAGIAMPGFVAGPCLEKDAYILASNMKESPSKNFILEAREISASLEDSVVQWAKEKIHGQVIALSGMAFKGRPETSDLRGSSSVNIARKLHALGYKLNLHDFVADSDEMRELNVGEVYENLREACSDAEALLILNNHEKYSDINFHDVGKNILVLDSWQVCKNLHGPELKIFTLGNILI